MFHTYNFFHFFKNRELNELYITMAIKSFALALIGIFIPIYLYKLGYSFSSIFFFYAVISLTHLIFTIPSAKIAAKFGIKHSILFSIPFLIVFLLLLYSLEQFHWPLYLLGMLFGFYGALFWMGYHTDFSKFSDKKKRGSEASFSSIICSLFYVIGPLAGGLILTFFGFKILFILVAILLLFSVIPLFLSSEVYEPMKFSLKDFFKKQKFKDSISFIGKGIELGLGLVVWPLFIFIFILNEKYLSVGFISSLTFLSAMLFIFVIGNFANRHRKKVLKISAISNALIWLVKSIIITPIQVIATDILYGFSHSSMTLSFDVICYDKANKTGILQFISTREIFHHVGKVLIFSLLMFTTNFISVFRFGGSIASLFSLFF